MKKFLVFCLLVSVGFNLYMVKSEYVVRDDFNDDYEEALSEKMVNDQITIAQSAIKKDCACSKTSLLKRKPKLTKKVVAQNEEPEIEDKQEYSEEVIREKLEARYNEWVDKSENFFLDELSLTAEQVASYRNLSKKRQNEISEYFNQKSKNAEEDSPSTYMFTSDDTIFMGRVAQKYENLLKDNFGEENYKKHKQFIKNHNDSIMTDEFVQVVEF